MFQSDVVTEVPAWFRNRGEHSDIVVSTRVRLARNVADHVFPSRASPAERKTVYEHVIGSLAGIDECRECKVLNFVQIERVDQQFLLENRSVSPDLIESDGERGVVCDAAGRIAIMVNEEDHLRMQCMDAGYCPDELWKVADALDDVVGRHLTYAYDGQKGFLTCCPTNCGTGLRVSFLLHLPGLTLTKTADQVLLGASQMGISTRGFFGEHSEVVGNLFQLSNQATMGAHEREFIESSKRIVEQVMDHERTARERILQQARLELTDKVHRACGILKHARTIAVDELLNLTSALRIGIECGLFHKTDVFTLNRMVLLCLPAHLQIRCQKVMDERESDEKRAELVREMMAGC